MNQYEIDSYYQERSSEEKKKKKHEGFKYTYRAFNSIFLEMFAIQVIEKSHTKQIF